MNQPPSKVAAEFALQERKFIHDIASPLSAAFFIIESVTDSLKENADENSEQILQLGQVMEALVKIKDMMKSRREVLMGLDKKEH